MEKKEAKITLQAHVIFACEKAGLSKAAVKTVEDALDLAISALEKQEQDRWIPVTERLPEKDGCYLVSVKNDHERRYSKTAWFDNDSWTMVRQKVLAWRPLPEPYTEGEE